MCEYGVKSLSSRERPHVNALFCKFPNETFLLKFFVYVNTHKFAIKVSPNLLLNIGGIILVCGPIKQQSNHYMWIFAQENLKKN